jgi:hypothetical protein
LIALLIAVVTAVTVASAAAQSNPAAQAARQWRQQHERAIVDEFVHSYNENLRIQNLWDGIELMAALLTM